MEPIDGLIDALGLGMIKVRLTRSGCMDVQAVM